jgi:formylglycine-generating enzyme required for sulfatase activity
VVGLLAEGVKPCVPQRTVLLAEGVEVRFSFIPPGSYLMGSPEGEEEREDDETLHRVSLTQGFWLGISPVTQAQWTAVMLDNPSHFKGDDLPVEQVLWDDCRGFCGRLGEKTGSHFRLPTEAQWEWACRAGTTTPFSFGDRISTDRANYDGNFTYGQGSLGVYREQTTPVGTYPPNAWGLVDLHGNVWEWCQDGYGPCQEMDVTDPISQEGPFRVMRGGAWFGYPWACRSACRGRVEPDKRSDFIGCRVLLCLD